MVDVAIDQGGCFETSHATTHSDPVYTVDTVSYAMQVAPDSSMAIVSSRSQAKWKYVNSNCPFLTNLYSGSIGSFTFIIISAMP